MLKSQILVNKDSLSLAKIFHSTNKQAICNDSSQKKKTMERAQNAGNDASEQETQNTMRSVFEIGEGSSVRAKGFEDALYIDM